MLVGYIYDIDNRLMTEGIERYEGPEVDVRRQLHRNSDEDEIEGFTFVT